jgi:hypothetical protein
MKELEIFKHNYQIIIKTNYQRVQKHFVEWQLI